MDNDDKPVGRILSRREVIALLGAAGMVAVAGRFPAQALARVAGGTAPGEAGTAAPACVVRPEQMEGPYFSDERLERADIRIEPMTGEVKGGIPLALTFCVFQIGDGCAPLPGATVDIWH